MDRFIVCIQFLLLCLMFETSPLFSSEMRFPWVVYYNDKAPTADFKPYNPVVFDSEYHPHIEALVDDHKDVLGYINLTEAEEYRPWFKELKAAGILIQNNPDWPDHWLIDIRKPKWKEFLLSVLIPDIFAQGFNGLLYDQLDNAIFLEREDPKKYKGMMKAAVDILEAIREKFVGKRLMMNRGFELIEEVGDSIDYVLAETLYTNYNFETKQYEIKSEEEFNEQLAMINAGRKKYPHLTVFTLEYWDPKDVQMYRKIYSLERGLCMRPYVTTIDLEKITPDP